MLKNLKSLFIVTEDNEPATKLESGAGPHQKGAASAQNPSRTNATTASASQRASPQTQSTRSATPLRDSVAVAPGNVNVSIVAKLLDAIDDNDLEGFDYLEYKRALKAMDPLPMDEATKFRSAFATASTVGASLERLLSSVQHYLSVLDQQRADFDAVVQRQLEVQVAGRESELASTQRGIDTKNTEIERLQAEITRLQAEIDSLRSKTIELSTGVEESRAKISTTKAEFLSSFEYVKSLFEQDAEKMKQYLK